MTTTQRQLCLFALLFVLDVLVYPAFGQTRSVRATCPAGACPAFAQAGGVRGFEANRGQLADSRTQFFTRLGHYSVGLDNSGASLYWNDSGKPRVATLSLGSGATTAPAQ